MGKIRESNKKIKSKKKVKLEQEAQNNKNKKKSEKKVQLEPEIQNNKKSKKTIMKLKEEINDMNSNNLNSYISNQKEKYYKYSKYEHNNSNLIKKSRKKFTKAKESLDIYRLKINQNLYENEKEKNLNYQPYPDYVDQNFGKIILGKKEFYNNRIKQNKIKNEDELIEASERMCNKRKFKLTPSQSFLRNYISPNTPYNGILIFHGVGVGKTCTAVSIAEQYREQLGEEKKKIIILANSTIHKQWKNTIIDGVKLKNGVIHNDSVIPQCTGNIYREKLGNIRSLEPEQYQKLINKTIDKYYSLYGYRAFANKVQKLKDKATKGYINDKKKKRMKEIEIINQTFSNTVLILDEAHNIRTGDSEKIAPPIIEEVIKYSDNLKLILLSATPMYNGQSEIVFLLNLLLNNDNRPTVTESMIFNKQELTTQGRELLKLISNSYISYLRGENPITFPLRLYPSDNIIMPEEFQLYQENGTKIEPEKQINFLKLYKDILSPFQFIITQNLISNNDIEDRKDSSIGSKELQMLNMIYPFDGEDEITEQLDNIESIADINVDIDESTLYGQSGFDLNFKTHEKQNGTKYFTYKNKDPFLDLDRIGKYSTKINAIINNILTSEGVIFVFSNYITGGILPLALALEQNGIQKYGGEGDQLLVSDTKKKSTKIKYILLTGDNALSPNKQEEINIVTGNHSSINNGDAKEIKVILGTSVTGEGLDFKKIREIHIMEPWYHLSKLEQIVGRGIRNCSHISLPYLKRNVTIYLHTAVNPQIILDEKKQWPGKWETRDYRIYRLAEDKGKKIGIITRLLKENAIDCGLNFYGNQLTGSNYDEEIIPDDIYNKQITVINSKNENIITSVGDKANSYICDWCDTCEYKCNNIETINLKKSQINQDTYNLKFSIEFIDEIKSLIKTLFKEYDYLQLNQIITKLNDYYIKTQKSLIDSILIYKALDDLINNEKEIIIRTNNDSGFIIYRGDNYIYQSNYKKNKQSPIYYRNLTRSLRKSSIPLSSMIELNDNSRNKSKLKKEYLQSLNANLKQDDNFLRKCTTIDTSISYSMLNQLIELIISLLDLLDTPEKLNKEPLLDFLKTPKDKKQFIEELGEILDGYFIKNERDLYYDEKKHRGNEIKGYKNYDPLTETIKYFTKKSEGSEYVELEKNGPIMKLITSSNSKKTIKKKQLGNIIGYLGNKKHETKKVFKYRNTSNKRNTGATCKDKKKPEVIKLMKSAGKLEIDINSIKEKPIESVCNEFNLFLRDKDENKIDGKRWFFRPFEEIPKN